MIKHLIAAALAIGILAAPAVARPTYQICSRTRCTKLHQAFYVRCGGETWVSPRPFHVPTAARTDPDWLDWCRGNVPAF